MKETTKYGGGGVDKITLNLRSELDSCTEIESYRLRRRPILLFYSVHNATLILLFRPFLLAAADSRRPDLLLTHIGLHFLWTFAIPLFYAILVANLELSSTT